MSTNDSLQGAAQNLYNQAKDQRLLRPCLSKSTDGEHVHWYYRHRLDTDTPCWTGPRDLATTKDMGFKFVFQLLEEVTWISGGRQRSSIWHYKDLTEDINLIAYRDEEYLIRARGLDDQLGSRMGKLSPKLEKALCCAHYFMFQVLSGFETGLTNCQETDPSQYSRPGLYMKSLPTIMKSQWCLRTTCFELNTPGRISTPMSKTE